MSDYLPEGTARAVPVLPLAQLESSLLAQSYDVVCLATPAEVSAEWAPKILTAGLDVIDLSGAFRLKASPSATYRQWYGFEHPQPELVGQAVYGLSPWCSAKPAKNATLVANPGCYATAVLMGILPLLKAGVIRPETLVIDAKSGTSGAGRRAAENLLFTEVDGECLPYKVGAHQHLPEICEATQELAHAAIDPFFCTSLLPIRRGIIAGMHARLAPGAGVADVHAAYAKAYTDYPLVRFGQLSTLSATAKTAALSLRRVVGTARTHLHYEVSGDKLYLFSLIDNLLKGAASQAVENLNWLYGWPVDTGLSGMEGTL